MKDQRCPWCGKKLSSGKTLSKRIKIGLKPVHQCPYCFNPMSSPLSTVLYTPILMIIVGIILDINLLFFLIFCLLAVIAFVACLFLIIFGKNNYYKMGFDGKRLESNEKKYKGYINGERPPKLRKNQLLLTDKDFDDREAFSASSPIRITKYSPKPQKIEYVFLYERGQNESLTENDAFIAYAPCDNDFIPLNVKVSKEN